MVAATTTALGQHPTDRQITSRIEVYDFETGTRTVVKEYPYVVEAPNWTMDGKYLIYNSKGKIFRLTLADVAEDVHIPTGVADNCNNDHVLSFDGRGLAVSSGTAGDWRSKIYVLPLSGVKECCGKCEKCMKCENCDNCAAAGHGDAAGHKGHKHGEKRDKCEKCATHHAAAATTPNHAGHAHGDGCGQVAGEGHGEHKHGEQAGAHESCGKCAEGHEGHKHCGGCGGARLVTPLAPSYLHGWSPDGKTLAYCAERGGNFDVYTIPVTGGEETRLTTTEGLDDGPEYSPDGNFIWFNSVRSGLMQVWRMRADGTEQTQITLDEGFNSWFPHVSPDNRRVVYIAYKKGDVAPGDHPAGRNVELRVISARQSGPEETIVKLFGGQGTLNVNSWAPDSRRFAFVSYEYK